MYTEGDLQVALVQKCKQGEQLYTQIGMQIAEDVSIFKDNCIVYSPKALFKIAPQDNLVHHWS